MSSQLPSSLVASPQARVRSSSISSTSTVSDISEWEVLEPLSPQTSPFEEIPPWSPKWVQQIYRMAKQSPQPAKQQQPYTAATKSTRQLPVASKELRQHLTTMHAQPTKREPSSAAAHAATGELPVTSKESSAVREVAGLREQWEIGEWEMEKKKERERILTKVEHKGEMNRGEEANALMDAETAKFYNEQSAAIKLQKESEWRMECNGLKQKKAEQQMEHERKQRRNPDMQLKKEQEAHARVNQAARKSLQRALCRPSSSTRRP